LTDHCRSRLRNAAKRSDIRDFYTDTIDIVRDTLLGSASTTEGGQRTGLPFEENNMRVYDVEVLNVNIRNKDVGALLTNAQTQALSGAIELSIAEDRAAREGQLEDLKRQVLADQQQTAAAQARARLELLGQQHAFALQEETNRLDQETEHLKTVEQIVATAEKRALSEADILRNRNNIEMERLTSETTEYARRLAAIQPDFIVAMTAFSDRALVEKIVTATAPAALAAGITTADILKNTFKGTTLEAIANALAERPLSPGRTEAA
jgi:hypothetical protein